MNTEKLIRKIKNYKKQDISKNRFWKDTAYMDLKYFKKFIKLQNGRCFHCKIKLNTDWTPFCLLQPCLDRIDDNKPHLKSNVVVNCFRCSCSWHHRFYDKYHRDGEFMRCKYKCHKLKRTIPLQQIKERMAEAERKKILPWQLFLEEYHKWKKDKSYRLF